MSENKSIMPAGRAMLSEKRATSGRTFKTPSAKSVAVPSLFLKREYYVIPALL
jgi:hypothetical protein